MIFSTIQVLENTEPSFRIVIARPRACNLGLTHHNWLCAHVLDHTDEPCDDEVLKNAVILKQVVKGVLLLPLRACRLRETTAFGPCFQEDVNRNFALPKLYNGFIFQSRV